MPFHVRCKKILKSILPTILFKKINWAWRRYFASYFTDTQADERYFTAYTKEYELTVSGGPFRGLQYIDASAGSVLLLKLVGSYEEVLHPIIEEAKLGNFDTVIDIGCAEGYYLVGLGTHLPQARLIGYDIDTTALSLTKQLALHNNLKNELVLQTTCTPDTLRHDITNNTVLICDAEGFEATIIDPKLTPKLTQVKLFIIETHDFAAPGVVSLLTERLAPTHTVERVVFKMASVKNYPFLQTITNKKHLYHLMRERGEQEQEWIIARRKS